MGTNPETGASSNDDLDLPQIAGYRLLGKLGEGGMGVVYEAEQSEPVRRKVALKVIRKGMDSKDVLARFDAERQALAMMDHPCIAKVFDAGETAEGMPFFVMDLVGGAPLTEFCESHQLTKEARLELFIQICKAVQHAHQKGIIHRDLKPSNILVSQDDEGGAPVPKIIDFGIAKAAAAGQKLTDQTLFTGFLQIVGTPAYMSPEQAEISGLDIDTRTDIYSLGVILYELLTGTLPFDAERFKNSAFAEIEKILWEEDPPSPSKRLASLADKQMTGISTARKTTPKKLLSEVSGELDWIVMKSIEKGRGRRYESATAFAEDVRRHLNNEPVAASPPSKLYIVRKFVRRHRMGIGTAATLALMMVAATAVSIWQAKRANEARVDADIARGDAERESATAKQNLRINDRMLSFLINDMLESGNPLKEADRDIKLRTVIDRAAAQLDNTFEEERDIRFALSMTMGRLYSTLGELDEARRLLESAKALGDDLWDGVDNRMVAGVRNALGTVALRQGKLEEAEELFDQSLQMYLRLQGEDSSYTIFSRLSLGFTYQQQQRLEEAARMLNETLPSSERVLGPNHAQTITLISTLGDLYKKLGKTEEANRYFALFESRYGKREVDSELSPVTLDAMNNRALVFMNQGKFAEALPLLEEVVELSKQTQGAGNPQTLISIHNLGAAYLQLGKPELAHPHFKEAMEGEIKALGEEHPVALGSLNDYATNCFRIPSEIENGVESLKRLVRLHKEHSGDNAAPLAFAYAGLQKYLPELGRESELVEIDRLLTGDVEWPAERTRTLVPRGATWRYFDGAKAESTFMELEFDDTGWQSGPAPLGYNDDHLATTIGFGDDEQDKHRTACFRTEFDVQGASGIERLKIRLRYDDLAEIFLNGESVARGESGRNSDRLAERLYYAIMIDPDQLVEGRNVLSVAVSQAEVNSSDLIFDLGLEALTAEQGGEAGHQE